MSSLVMKLAKAVGSGASVRQVAALCDHRSSLRFGGDGAAYHSDVSEHQATPPPPGEGSK